MAMNAFVDERTLREIYLTNFEISVKESRPKAVVSSYNETNGTYANGNRYLLKEILCQDWALTEPSLRTGVRPMITPRGAKRANLEMPAPGLDSARELIRAVSSGKIAESDINELITVIKAVTGSCASLDGGADKGFNKEELHRHNHEVARRAAAEGVVLFKNNERPLPLAPQSRAAIIGDFAFASRY